MVPAFYDAAEPHVSSHSALLLKLECLHEMAILSFLSDLYRHNYRELISSLGYQVGTELYNMFF